MIFLERNGARPFPTHVTKASDIAFCQQPWLVLKGPLRPVECLFVGLGLYCPVRVSPAVSFTKKSIEGNLPRPLIDPSNMRLSPTLGSHSSQSSLYDFFGAERCKTVPYACNQSERHCILPTTLVGFERSITPCGMSFCRAGALLPCKGVPSRILRKGKH